MPELLFYLYAGPSPSLRRDAQGELPQLVDPFAQSGSENLFSGLSLSATDLEAAGELLSFPPVPVTGSDMELSRTLRSPTGAAGKMPPIAAEPKIGAVRPEASDVLEPSPRGESSSMLTTVKAHPLLTPSLVLQFLLPL